MSRQVGSDRGRRFLAPLASVARHAGCRDWIPHTFASKTIGSSQALLDTLGVETSQLRSPRHLQARLDALGVETLRSRTLLEENGDSQALLDTLDVETSACTAALTLWSTSSQALLDALGVET